MNTHTASTNGHAVLFRDVAKQYGDVTALAGATFDVAQRPPRTVMDGRPIRVLLAEDKGMVRGALAALLSMEDDLDVVAEVGRGDEVEAAVAALSEGSSPLTEREAEVLAAARSHDSIAELAGRLHLSSRTVRNHLSAAMRKLGARNRAEAVDVAERKGWL
jgi:two-component system response regulator DesR